jgi:hypothetical protein
MEDRGCSLWHGRIVHVSLTVVTLTALIFTSVNLKGYGRLFVAKDLRYSVKASRLSLPPGLFIGYGVTA